MRCSSETSKEPSMVMMRSEFLLIPLLSTIYPFPHEPDFAVRFVPSLWSTCQQPGRDWMRRWAPNCSYIFLLNHLEKLDPASFVGVVFINTFKGITESWKTIINLAWQSAYNLIDLLIFWGKVCPFCSGFHLSSVNVFNQILNTCQSLSGR